MHEWQQAWLMQPQLRIGYITRVVLVITRTCSIALLRISKVTNNMLHALLARTKQQGGQL